MIYGQHQWGKKERRQRPLLSLYHFYQKHRVGKRYLRTSTFANGCRSDAMYLLSILQWTFLNFMDFSACLAKDQNLSQK